MMIIVIVRVRRVVMGIKGLSMGVVHHRAARVPSYSNAAETDPAVNLMQVGRSY